MGGVVEEAQTCAISGRYIHDNLRLIRYSLERVGKTSGKSGALVHLELSKAFDSVYLAAVLEAADLGADFRSWITAMYSGIKSKLLLFEAF